MIAIFSIITNVVKLLLIVYALLYTKKKKPSEGESRLNKKITIYFMVSIVANLIVSALGDNFNLYVAFTRTLSLLFVYFFIIYLSYNINNINNYFRIFMNVSIVLLVASILVYFFMPEIGKSYEGNGIYVFKGLALNRNSVYELIMPIIPLTLFFADNGRKKLYSILLICVVSIVIFFTKSATSILSLSVYLVILFLDKFIKNKKRLIIGLVLTLTAIWGFTLLAIPLNKDIGFITNIFDNKSETLSGRTDIWKKAANYIKDRPLFGYGYDNQIIGDNGYNYNGVNKDFPNDTHNSILFLLLSTGLVGTAIYLYLLFISLKTSISIVSVYSKYKYLIYYIIVFMFRGLTESCWHYSHLFFFSLVMIMPYVSLSINNMSDNRQQRIEDEKN